ncbi:hypothetical protein JOM56_011296 [Amanita muscaria]
MIHGNAWLHADVVRATRGSRTSTIILAPAKFFEMHHIVTRVNELQTFQRLLFSPPCPSPDDLCAICTTKDTFLVSVALVNSTTTLFAARMKVALMMKGHDTIIDARVKQADQANGRRRKADFVEGDLVHLATKNLRIPRVMYASS